MLGMIEPGLCLGASMIHALRFSGVLGNMPAAIVVRVATLLRLGPTTPYDTPSIMWQATHWPFWNRARPFAASLVESGGGTGAFCSLIHASKPGASSTNTLNIMLACDAPQNSAHWPGNSPLASGANHMWFVRPGMTSRLPEKAGI